MSELSPVEKKILGALLSMADRKMKVTASNAMIAQKIGYKSSGGIITYALQTLIMKDYLMKDNNEYTVLI